MYGENGYKWMSWFVPLKSDCVPAVQLWYKQWKNYNFSSPAPFDDNWSMDPDKMVGAFTQVGQAGRSPAAPWRAGAHRWCRGGLGGWAVCEAGSDGVMC